MEAQLYNSLERIERRVQELIGEREALQAENARLRDANSELMADAVCDESEERTARLLEEHGVLDEDLWDSLMNQRDKAQAENARLRELLERVMLSSPLGEGSECYANMAVSRILLSDIDAALKGESDE